ncbi:hypothetical protein Salat_1862200 [Sesamum alatum]|uniref:Wall-associated receptor kinase galacturonan-binding domain-containing protein n=1 Tax=Sesamum alatum TaxID=300844 RepID=A0AAE1Y3F4_9LAMI|nr:hypothetical protein Salat_1862200 [Sesamum alatum]
MVYFLQTSYGELNPQCPPSSCGNIHNISNPFRLKDDPKHCGNPIYELECENNTTSVYLNSHRYLVQAIIYSDYTIRLVDAGITNDSCSFPQYSLGSYNFKRGYPFDMVNMNTPITLMSCPYPVNSSRWLEIDHCADRNYSFTDSTSNRRRTYVKFGHFNGLDVKDMCRIERIVMTSLPVKDETSFSLSEIHSSLLYGFELSWFSARCGGNCVCFLFPIGDDATEARCDEFSFCKFGNFLGKHPFHCSKSKDKEICIALPPSDGRSVRWRIPAHAPHHLVRLSPIFSTRPRVVSRALSLSLSSDSDAVRAAHRQGRTPNDSPLHGEHFHPLGLHFN